MRVVKGIENYRKGRGLSLALGNFDGVHLGHQRLIRDTIRDARQRDTEAAALIFDPHPMKVLRPDRAPRMLISTARKLEIFEALGLEVVVQTPFTRDIARMTPEYFARAVLHETLGVAAVFVGFNYTFGHKGEGVPATMQALGHQLGFAVHVVPPVRVGNAVVSSTLVRQAIEAGDVTTAHSLLGYWPMLEGPVVEGERRGASIGFPTANMGVPDDLVVPATGVYAARALVRDTWCGAVVNVGRKPTFHADFPLAIEAHLFDFHRVIYGETMRLYFLQRLRGEKKFRDVGELTAQIARDAQEARRVIEAIRFTPF
ncbi:MAG: bifunctional riboflavin kinase/FAD synthetase [Syntrophomonadaceae bacterium]|nr:bifunctional riboflavin kinase/FAD synthetase [Syntrophomonadaceae bacterium]